MTSACATTGARLRAGHGAWASRGGEAGPTRHRVLLLGWSDSVIHQCEQIHLHQHVAEDVGTRVASVTSEWHVIAQLKEIHC